MPALIHEASPRREHPFVVFDCAATDTNLVGDAPLRLQRGRRLHRRGEMPPRKGTFLTAHTGTLFIDEIGDLPLDIQPGLLKGTGTPGDPAHRLRSVDPCRRAGDLRDSPPSRRQWWLRGDSARTSSTGSPV